ncbi:type VI secretion system protein TssA [Aggregatibacter kilianii]|uniref:type VI secretion system protein TssA n=1 Tax=Aggregatibacter kilianii TaxID=2025884 RepID=UPI000D64D70C|nr:type VI secretion system protein TssA [Aggregatibacter kilianii]
MDLLIDHPWRVKILKPIDTEIDLDEDPVWIDLDGEMVKLGSLEHESLDISSVQQKALTLLSTKSKDVRLVAHLLKTLQHSGKTTELLLGLALLADYVEAYWASAPPAQKLKKVRLAQQILKRFENMGTKFNQSASRLEKDEAKIQLERLKHYWGDEQKLLHDIELLLSRYTFSDTVNIGNADTEVEKPGQPMESKIDSGNLVSQKSMVIEPLEIDQSNEKAWRNTLLKVADYLIDKDPSESVGYRLRRYAIWSNITSAPFAEGNKTQLAAISVDRVSEYKAALENVSIDLWKEVEYSLTLAPFWFEGHYLSAEIANRLGYTKVAEAIKESLRNFFERLPSLIELTFSDGTPFLPQNCQQWLAQHKATQSDMLIQNRSNQNIDDYYEKEGLEKTLQLINEQKYSDMRERVYAQLHSIKLLNKSGLHSLAKQHYATLQSALESVSVKDWEPSLFSLLMKEQE